MNKVRIARLLDEELVTSTGSQTWTYRELPQGEIADWGPYLESIRIHAKASDQSAEFEWKVVLWWSYDGFNWEGPVDVYGPISTSGQAIQDTPFGNRSALGLHIRFGIGARNTTAGTDRRSALVSCSAAFEFLS